MSQLKIKPKNAALKIEYEKLGVVIMPQLMDLVMARLPDKEHFEKAITELNALNVNLQTHNQALQASVGVLQGQVEQFKARDKILSEQLESYNKTIDETFKEHDDNIKLLLERIQEKKEEVAG